MTFVILYSLIISLLIISRVVAVTGDDPIRHWV